MNLVLKTFTIFLLSLQTCSLAIAGDICQSKGEDLVLHRNYKTGETSCCLNVKCSPGQEAVICDRNDPRSTTCRSCPDGTYQPDATDSADMLHCNAKTQCYGNLSASARHEKSKTKDTRCVCNPKIGTCNPAGITKNPRWCIKKTCAPGFRLTSKCVCEDCKKTENKSRQEQKPCDKKDRLCRNKRETSTSETDISTLCPEDNPESPTKVATEMEKIKTVENPGPILPSSIVPQFSSLIDKRQSNDDVTSDYLNGDVSSDKSVSWYIIFISAVFVACLVGVVVCIIFVWRHYFHKSDSTSPSGIKTSASAVSNSTDDTDIDGVTIERSGESSSLMPPKTSPSSATNDNGVMRLSDKEKLTAQRPVLVQNLVFDEYLWAMLQCNETITSEMKAQIDRSTSSDPEKAGALITYLLKRNSHAFATFVAALIYTKQEHLARALDPGLTAEIKENCKEDDQLMSYVLNLVQPNKDICMSATQS